MAKARIPELEGKIRRMEELLSYRDIELNRLRNRLEIIRILLKPIVEELEEVKSDDKQDI